MAARLLVAVAAVLLNSCGAAPASTPVWSIESAEVLFTVRRGDRSDLYRWSAAEGTTARLQTPSAYNNFGRWSPDGRRIAFQSRSPGSMTELFVMNADGTGLQRLTDHPDYDVLPAWSPDGRRIAFMSTRGVSPVEGAPFPGHVYVMDADGDGLRQVTAEPLTSSLGPQAWTRDGRGILISRERDGQLDLFRLDVETGEEILLSGHPASEYGASVSLDGALIACHAEADGASQLVIMNVNGSNRRLVTSGPGRRYGPRWSPDGEWLVFTEEADGDQHDLRAVHLPTGALRTLVATSEDEREPDWAPPKPTR